MKNKFTLGEIVTFRTHPLLYSLKTKGDGKFVPPFMVVKEVFFENNKKKIVDDSTGEIIGEKIKYTCSYFDDNKSEFKEAFVYESMLDNYKKIFLGRLEGEIDEKSEDYMSLIDKASKYKKAKYKYGNIIYFKTKNFEIFKKRSSKRLVYDIKKGKKALKEKEIIQYVVNYSTPEFILCGHKTERKEGLFYPNGEIKKIISNTLYKVKWFNPFQMKFSEEYLPCELFIDEQPFETDIPHNK